MHSFLTELPWTACPSLIPPCELMERLAASYLSFLVVALLKNESMMRRLAAGLGMIVAALLISGMILAFVSMPVLSKPLSLVFPCLQFVMVVWLVLTYRSVVDSA